MSTHSQLDVCPLCDECVWFREGDRIVSFVDDLGRLIWMECTVCEGVVIGNKIVSKEVNP